MTRATLGGPLPLAALALFAGVVASGHTGALAAAPGPWLAAAAFLALVRPAGAVTTAQVLAAVVCLGAARGALERARVAPLPAPARAAVERGAAVDLVGRIRGPVVDRRGARHLEVDLEAPFAARVQATVRGSPMPDLLPGDRIALRGRLRLRRDDRVSRGGDRRGAAEVLAVAVAAAAVVPVQENAYWSGWRWPTQLQRSISSRIAARGSDPQGNALVRAMVIGDRGGLSRSTEEHFRAAGIAHIVAVSGLHLACVALFLFAAVRRAWAAVPALALRLDPAAAAAIVAMVAAIVYTAATGARVSTLRALLVVLVCLAAQATARRVRLIDAIAAAAVLLLVHAPGTALDPSFQLSFAAATTLALMPRRRVRPDASRLVRLGRWIVSLAAVSVAASLATAPVTAMAFGEVATGGLVTNFVAVPAAELLIMPFGLAGGALALFSAPAAAPLLAVAIAMAGWLEDLAAAVAAFAPVLTVPPPNAVEWVAVAVLWTTWVAARRGLMRRRHAAAAALGAGLAGMASFWVTSYVAPQWRDELRVTFVDVGQGDAAVIELPGGGAWLIDGGGLPFVTGADDLDPVERELAAAVPGERAVARFLVSRRIRALDLAVVSHPHPDHFAGLPAIARRVPIAELWLARPHPEQEPARPFQELVGRLHRQGTAIRYPPLGRARRQRGVALAVLAPRGEEERDAAADPVLSTNDNSLVVLLEFAGRRFLFAGDLEAEGEELLLAAAGGAVAGVDVVKVPHHGSRTSSSPELVTATAPRFAVISCGLSNRFGFPASEVLERWQAAGAEILRTDRDGSITVTISERGELSVSYLGGADARR